MMMMMIRSVWMSVSVATSGGGSQKATTMRSVWASIFTLRGAFFANAFLVAMLGCWASNLGLMTDSTFQHVNLAYMRKPPETSHRVMS